MGESAAESRHSSFAEIVAIRTAELPFRFNGHIRLFRVELLNTSLARVVIIRAFAKGPGSCDYRGLSLLRLLSLVRYSRTPLPSSKPSTTTSSSPSTALVSRQSLHSHAESLVMAPIPADTPASQGFATSVMGPASSGESEQRRDLNGWR